MGEHCSFDTFLAENQLVDPALAALAVIVRGIVFDTESSKVVGRIPDVRSVHGVLAVPRLGRVYATAIGANEVVAIDVATRTIIARVSTGSYPDGIAFAPDAGKLYVSEKTTVQSRSLM